MTEDTIKNLIKLTRDIDTSGNLTNDGLTVAYASNTYAASTFTSNNSLNTRLGGFTSNNFATGFFAANTYLQDALGSAGVPSGTKQIFVQTAAPTGWTKDTTHDNKALRVVTGTAGSGGTDSFTTTFGSGKSTQSHTLSTPQMPSHNHPMGRGKAAPPSTNQYFFSRSPGLNDFRTDNVGNAGGGGSHSHSLSLNVAYVDTIIATKD